MTWLELQNLREGQEVLLTRDTYGLPKGIYYVRKHWSPVPGKLYCSTGTGSRGLVALMNKDRKSLDWAIKYTLLSVDPTPAEKILYG